MRIASVGVYELFVARIGAPAGERLPGWLQMCDLNGLKVRVVSMIVLIVAMDFVQALVVVSLTAFVRLGQGHDSP